MDLRLKDKVALVTGGARGLGEAVCRRLAAEGVRVVVNFQRSAEEANHLVRSIQERYGVQALAVSGDVSREDDVVRMFREAESAFPAIDILVNNAGVCPTCLVKDMSADLWNRTVGVNLTGTFLSSREMVRHLLARQGTGHILNIVSPAAFKGSVNGKTHYSAAKAGVVGFTVSLAREVAAQGIRVNAVAPGMMLTDMTEDLLRADEGAYRKSIPLGRIARAEEVAEAISFLVSDRNSYMTGATVDLSGGTLMR